MRSFLKIFLQLHDVRGFVVHWRLNVPMMLGAAVACVVWALLSSQTIATLLWVLIVGVGATVGMIWDRNHNEKQEP